MSVYLGTTPIAGETYDKAATNLSNLTPTGRNVIEGQFVKKDVTVASGVSLNGSSSTTYTLSDLPNDGNNYLVWINVEAVTGSTSGNYINVKIGSSLITTACFCRVRTRTASTCEGGGYAVIPVSSDRKIVLDKSTNWNGTTNIYMHGYRRIGTNS